MNSVTDTSQVTVIVVHFNQARFAQEAIASAVEQGVKVLVVDDGSQPTQLAQLRDVVAGFPDIRLEADGHNLGLSGRLNSALQHVDTPWLSVLAADDAFEPGGVAALLNAASPDDAVVWGNLALMDEAGVPLGTSRPRNSWQRPIARRYLDGGRPFQDLLRFNNFVTGGMSLIRTDVVRQAGGWDPQVTTEDFDLWLRLSRSHTFRYVDSIVGRYRAVAGSKSRRISHKLHDNIALLSKHVGVDRVTDAGVARTAMLRWIYTAARLRRLPELSVTETTRALGLKRGALWRQLPLLAIQIGGLVLVAQGRWLLRR
jgi:glycosyltransferase involved in cell wall biosynthesis